MESRDEAIEFVREILQEDIVDQFHINEVDAALEGKTIFTIRNKQGEEVTLQNFFQEHSELLVYDLISCTLLVRPPNKNKRRICNHPRIEKGLHEKRYTCLRCGLIEDEEFFREQRDL